MNNKFQKIQSDSQRIYIELQQQKQKTEKLIELTRQLDSLIISMTVSNRWRIGNFLYKIYKKVFNQDFEKSPQDIRENLIDRLKHLEECQKHLTRDIKTASFEESESILSPLNQGCIYSYQDAHQAICKQQIPTVSIAILSLNGAKLLDELFDSIFFRNTYSISEIILVDHASNDNTFSVVQKWQAELPIKYIHVADNFSFSYSNNRVAEIAKGDILVFLNNDIIFKEDCLPRLTALFKDPSVGIVGVKQYELDKLHDDLFPAPKNSFHHIGIRFHADTRIGFSMYRPYNVKPTDFDNLIAQIPAIVPAVTGSFMLVRREDFLRVGGFNERYIYGFEDVDFCLKMRLKEQKIILSANDTYAFHGNGQTRRVASTTEKSNRRKVNDSVFQKRFGYYIRRENRRLIVEGDGTWRGRPTQIAFAVTEASPNAKAGDYFTALEFGSALSRHFGWQVRYLPLNEWYDLGDVDIAVAMRDDFNPQKIENAPPHQIKVAWLRNWFERWPKRPGFNAFDIILCSSKRSASYVQEVGGVPTDLLRIATNAIRFRPLAEVPKAFDYVFTGSYWGAEREIMSFLNPKGLPYRGALYGEGWREFEPFESIHYGFQSYSELPKVYNSSKIVIDDANHVTKSFGSVNSRVFDALASGTLVLTNGIVGGVEVFGDLLPTFTSQAELEGLLAKYLSDDELREETLKLLRRKVLNEHTYDYRAKEFRSILAKRINTTLRIAIKIPVPDRKQANEWGDYHFACALARALKKYGHSIRIDFLPEWENSSVVDDDVVFVLRGLSVYTPRPDQINIMWNISHPDKVSLDEYEAYDHVFVASRSHASVLGEKLTVPVSELLQCTDPLIFSPPNAPIVSAEDLLFVGNSRNIYRQIVKDSIQAGFKPTVYGTRWQQFISSEYLKGEHLENKDLAAYYNAAKIVLNDHWKTMAEYGFLSNRLFDAGASESLIISDSVNGIEEVFGDLVVTYTNVEDLREKIQYFLANPELLREKAAKLRDLIVSNHTFDHRVEKIVPVLQNLHEKRMQCPDDRPLPSFGDRGFPQSVLKTTS